MARITRNSGYALALVFFSLSAFTAANAQAASYKYWFCYGMAGNPRGETFTRAFVLGPSSAPAGVPGSFIKQLSKLYGGFITPEYACQMYATAAEAEAARRKLWDEIASAPANGPVVEIDWIPQGATALSAPAKAPAPPTAAPKPQAPAPTTAAAPAASPPVLYDRWGKPIPTTAYWVCESRLNKYLYLTAPFLAATDSHTAQDIYVTFLDYLVKKYHHTGTATCNKFASQAEAEQSNAKLAAEAPGNGYQYQSIDWIYAPGAPVAAAAPATAPVKAPTAVANAGVAPKPAPVVVAAKPAAPAPANPATAAAKSAVYVICRAEWNPDMRRFYNPPVDGRGAGYPEWQASWHKYLVEHYHFKDSNFGCGDYPTREAAQTDFESWVETARQTPTMNGLPSPVIITNWKY